MLYLFCKSKNLTFEFIRNLQEIVDNYREFYSFIISYSMKMYDIIKQVKEMENLHFMRKLKENHMESLNGHQ